MLILILDIHLTVLLSENNFLENQITINTNKPNKLVQEINRKMSPNFQESNNFIIFPFHNSKKKLSFFHR